MYFPYLSVIYLFSILCCVYMFYAIFEQFTIFLCSSSPNICSHDSYEPWNPSCISQFHSCSSYTVDTPSTDLFNQNTWLTAYIIQEAYIILYWPADADIFTQKLFLVPASFSFFMNILTHKHLPLYGSAWRKFRGTGQEGQTNII